MDSKGGRNQFQDEVDEDEEEIDEEEDFEEEEEDQVMEDQSYDHSVEVPKKKGLAGRDQSFEEESADDSQDYIIENQNIGQKSEFRKFTDKDRINNIFQAMSETQKERFEIFRQSNFDEKKMKKILTQILGTTGKMHKNISAIIKSVAKIYVGQLVEESKQIQIEEIEESQGGVKLVNQVVDLGPIQPHHLVEARRRLLSRGELISEKPNPMFRRK